MLTVCAHTSIGLSLKMESIQLDAARTCTGALITTNSNSLLQELGWTTLAERRKHHKLTLYYKMARGLTPSYIRELLPRQVAEVSRYPLHWGVDVFRRVHCEAGNDIPWELYGPSSAAPAEGKCLPSSQNCFL